MKSKLISPTLAGLLLVSGSGLAAETMSPNALEPCINGQVSATGLYPTQAQEDAAFAKAKNRQQASNGRAASAR